MGWAHWGTIIRPTAHGPSNDGPTIVQVELVMGHG